VVELNKGIFAIVIVAILMGGLFWYFTQETTEQSVTIREDWGVNISHLCGITVALRTDVDGTEFRVMADVKLTHPDGDVEELQTSGMSAFDDFCGGDWTIEITPTKYQKPGGTGDEWINVDGEKYTHTISIPTGQYLTLTFVFEWITTGI
jgi:hypothetical protein